MGKLKKLIASLSIAAISLVSVVTTAFGAFPDTNGHWSEDYVQAAADAGVFTGYEDGTFKPDNAMTRAEVAATVARAKGLELGDGSSLTFVDVPSDHWGVEEIEAMVEAGYMMGDDTGNTFRPNDTMNRAELAAVMVRAWDLPLMPTAMFPDVPADAWFNDEVGALVDNGAVSGYENGMYGPADAVTRGQVAKVTVNVAGLEMPMVCEEGEEMVDGECVVMPTECPEGEEMVAGQCQPVDCDPETDEGCVAPPTAEGTLQVYLASDTPAAGSIPQNGFQVPFTRLVLNAEGVTGGDVEVSGLTVTREGLGSPENFDSVVLYRVGDDKQLSSEKNVSTSTNQAVLTTRGFTVPAGSMVVVEVRADLAGTDANNLSGAENSLGVVAAEDVDANVPVELVDAPVMGATKTLANVVSAEVTSSQEDVVSEFEIGDQGELLGEADFTMENEDGYFTKFAYTNSGSADSDAFANLELRDGGDVLAATYEWDGDVAVFMLDEPYEVEEGDTLNLRLYGDIVGGIDDTVGFEFKEDGDVVAYGSVTGFRAKVDLPAFSPTKNNITGGDLNVSLADGNPPEQDIMDGGEDIEFMRFNVTVAGDDALVKEFALHVDPTLASASEVEDVRIYRVGDDGELTGSIVAGPVDGTDTDAGDVELLTFTDDWEVESGTNTFAVLADLSTAVQDGDDFTFSIDMDGGTLEAEYLSDGTEIDDITPAADVEGSTMTVATANLTFSANSDSQDKDVIINTRDVEVSYLNAKSSTVSPSTITSFKLSLTNALGAATYQDLDQCAVYHRAGDGTMTRLTRDKSLTDAATDFVQWTDIDHTVPAGATHVLVTVCDIPSSATVGNTPGLGIAAVGDVEADDSENQDVTILGTPNSADTADDDVLTIKASGTLTVEADADTPSPKVVSTGTNMVHVSSFEFESEDDSFEVTKTRFKVAAASADEISGVVVEYMNAAGETVVSDPIPVNNSGYADFDVTRANAMYVPKDDEAVVHVYVNTRSESQGADSGAALQLDLDFDTEFEAFGVEGDNRLTQVGAEDADGEEHYVYASDLLVKASDNTPSTVSEGSDKAVFKFDLTNNGENNPTLMALGVTVSGTAALEGNATGNATLDSSDTDDLATEAYVAYDSDGGADVVAATTINIGEAPEGVPVGATVIVNDDGTYYPRTVTAISAGDAVTFTPAITGYNDTADDDLIYAPMQPGSGKLYFGFAREVVATAGGNADDIEDGDTQLLFSTTAGLSIGDTLDVRGLDVDGEVVECEGAAVTALTGTVATTAITCATTIDDIDNAELLQTPVAYSEAINDEIGTTEQYTVRGDVNGATPNTGTKNIELSINAGSDIAWHDEWEDVGDDTTDNDKNASFIIRTDLLNKEKEGVNNFPVLGESLQFEG